VVGQLVARCLARGEQLGTVPLAELRELAPEFDDEVLRISVQSAIDARDVPGGTARRRVEAALAESRRQIAETSAWAVEMRGRLPTVEGLAQL
jgi:argininosuccinate lyase